MPGRGVLENELDLTVFIACYNEEANIVAALDTVREALRDAPFTWEIIVIDDGSTDRSVPLIEDYIRRHPKAPVRFVVNEKNRGLAQNYIEGAFLGRGKYYRLVSGDNVEDVATLREIFSHVGESEIVVFYHGDNRERPRFRRALSRLYTSLVNLLSGHRLRYYNGSAILLRYDVMRWHTNYHGFGFQADLTCRLLDEGVSYVEVPVRATERKGGRSKALTAKNILSVGHTFLDLFIRRVANLLFRRNPARSGWRERTELYAPREESAKDGPVLAGPAVSLPAAPAPRP